MAGLSTFTINKIRDHIYRTATWSKPAALYVSLHEGDPGLTGANEVSEGWYARVQRNPGDANWDDVADGVAELIAALAFGNPTGMSGSIIVTHVGVWDASTSGNFIQGGALTQSKTINNGDAAPEFEAGDLRAEFE